MKGYEQDGGRAARRGWDRTGDGDSRKTTGKRTKGDGIIIVMQQGRGSRETMKSGTRLGKRRNTPDGNPGNRERGRKAAKGESTNDKTKREQ